jgi:hypothetical protein
MNEDNVAFAIQAEEIDEWKRDLDEASRMMGVVAQVHAYLACDSKYTAAWEGLVSVRIALGALLESLEPDPLDTKEEYDLRMHDETEGPGRS